MITNTGFYTRSFDLKNVINCDFCDYEEPTSPNMECDSENECFEQCINPDVAVGDEFFPGDQMSCCPEFVAVDRVNDSFDLYNSSRERCPSFASQIHEQSTGSVIQHYFITDEMISNAAKYAAQIACVNLSYSTYIPSSSSDPAVHHCCPVCQRSLLLAVSQFFYNNNMDDLHDLSPGMPINPSTPKFAATLQIQQGMEHSLNRILQSLRNHLHVRPTELIHALHYFDLLLKRHWMCSTFILFRQSLKTIFAVCCLIAHKMNSDNPFRNTAWSELFQMPIQTINEFERSILTLLEYQTRVDESRFHELEAIVGVGEDYYMGLGECSSFSSESESESELSHAAVTSVATAAAAVCTAAAGVAATAAAAVLTSAATAAIAASASSATATAATNAAASHMASMSCYGANCSGESSVYETN